MTLAEFVAMLPTCTPVPFASTAPTGHGVAFHRVGLPEFVAPDLITREDVAPSGEPTVVIISAAGAVGKSTIAREIAVQRGALCLDLAKSGSVGSDKLGGALLSAFGPAGIGSGTTALAAGKLFLLIGALDEARVKVTERAFEDFISDIAAMAKTPGRIRFVLSLAELKSPRPRGSS